MGNYSYENSSSLRSIDVDGRMHVKDCNISKECVNPYYGYEIPDYQNLGLDKDKIYYLYRPGNELEKSAKTFNGIQVMEKHSPVFSDDTKKDLVIGTTGTDAKFEKPYLKNTVIFWDKNAIDTINAADENMGGAKELSCGYSYRPVMVEGIFEGQRYDGWMADIKGNHVALVENGRAGSDVKVSDSNIFLKAGDKMAKDRKKMMDIAKSMDIEIDSDKLDKLISALKEHEESENATDKKTKSKDKKIKAKDKDEWSSSENTKSLYNDNKYDNGTMEGSMDEEEEDMSEDEEKEDDDKDEDKKSYDKKMMKRAMDSLENKLRNEFLSIESAKNDVKEIIGDVYNINSAENIYKFALDSVGIENKNIKDLNALKSIFNVYKKYHKTNNEFNLRKTVAMDEKDSNNIYSLIPNLKRFK